MFGFLVINKPKAITSRTALDMLAKPLKPTKVGHAGTLDPLATGVLVACIGPATRLANYVQQMPKTYTADFRLGLSSTTEDIEGELTPLPNGAVVSAADLSAVLPRFLGTVTQLPPQFSALKVGGRRSYDLARQGNHVDLKSRDVEIYKLVLTKFEYPDFQLMVECGSGTYVRSLGRDIAMALGTEAVMTDLIRSSIGEFRLTEAVDLRTLDVKDLPSKLVPPAAATIGLKSFCLTREQLPGFLNGRPLQLVGFDDEEEVAAIDEDGRLIAILRRRNENTFVPAINFAHYWTSIDEDVK